MWHISNSIKTIYMFNFHLICELLENWFSRIYLYIPSRQQCKKWETERENHASKRKPLYLQLQIHLTICLLVILPQRLIDSSHRKEKKNCSYFPPYSRVFTLCYFDLEWSTLTFLLLSIFQSPVWPTFFTRHFLNTLGR